MKKLDPWEKWIAACWRQREVNTHTESSLDERIVPAMQAAFAAGQTRGEAIGGRLWRRLTATAAGLALLVLLHWCLRSGESLAYAVEQTLAALQEIRTIHTVGTDWDGNRFETWQRIDPNTGRVVWCSIDQTPHGYKIAARPDGSCVWDKDGKVVRYVSKPIASNDSRYTHIFKQITERMATLREGESITTYTEAGPEGQGTEIVIHVVTEQQDYHIFIDPETRLPRRYVFDRADNMKQIAQSVDEIYYDVPLPNGLFDFIVPAKWYRDWSLLDNPTKGLAIGDLSHAEGAVKTARQYWQAVIKNDWETADRLRPVADWKTDYHKERPAALVEVASPRLERGCSGMVTPCVVRFSDGSLQRVELVINLREITGQRSCIIVATWGWPEDVSEE